ncbi:MAG: ribosome maturation factor RimM [Gammaproteobacteria bacterium]
MSQQALHIQLGIIQGVFGIKGWLKILSFCRPKEKIFDYSLWEVRTSAGAECYVLQEGKLHGNGIIAKLKNIEDRNQAEALKGAGIWVARLEMPELAENEFYWFQLEGLNVISVDGDALGRVKRMMETGANDVMVVVDEDKQEILVPYIREQVVKHVDLQQKTITVDWQKDY